MLFVYSYKKPKIMPIPNIKMIDNKLIGTIIPLASYSILKKKAKANNAEVTKIRTIL